MVAVVLNTLDCPSLGTLSRAEGLLTSLNSIISQETTTLIEIIIVTAPDSTGEAPYQNILEKNPWIPSVRFLYCTSDQQAQAAYTQSIADYFIFLSVGDELLPGAVKLLLDHITESEHLSCYGACRWSDNTASWSHPSVDQFFEMPAVTTITELLQASTLAKTSLGLLHRSLLQEKTDQTSPKAIIVKDYICIRQAPGEISFSPIYPYPKPIYQKAILPAQMPVSELTTREGGRRSAVWLFGERAGESAEDNAWALFKYCVDNCPYIESYYVLKHEKVISPDPKYQSRILIKGSPEWSKHIERASHMCFTDTAADILVSSLDALNYNDVDFIYLTHGYLAYSPGVYQRGHPYFNRVICTSAMDVDAASRFWGFPKSSFIQTGLPRWDNLRDSSAGHKEILILPTWRKTFDSSHWSASEALAEDDIHKFKTSAYFKHFNALLKSAELNKLLLSHDARVTFKLHFRLEKYLPLFEKTVDSKIRISTRANDNRNIKALLEDASMLITDYSSVMFDMGQMEKPVICYQFDKAAMLGERKIDAFALADTRMFTDMCSTQVAVIHQLEEYLLSGFTIPEHKLRRLNHTLPFRDRGNCKRVVNKIQQLQNKPAHGSAKVAKIIKQPDITSYLKRLDWVKTDESTKIGYLLNIPISKPTAHIAINPDNWKKIISAGDIDILLIEPHLNARSQWAPVFFNAGGLLAFLHEISDFAQQHGVASVLLEPHYHLFFDNLLPLNDHFDHYVPLATATDISPAYSISVIIPAYNCEHYISHCIDSILRQSYTGSVELVIVDDGSTDTTWDVITSYSHVHSNVTAIRQYNAKQGMARNRGLDAARGQFVTFVDADDLLPVNCLADLFHEISLSGADISIGLVASTDEKGNTQQINQSYYHYSKAPRSFTPASWPHVFYDPSCVGKLISRRFLLEHKIYFPQSYHEDQVFNFKLFTSATTICKTNAVVYLYIARPAASPALSGTQTFTAEKFRQILIAAQLAISILDTSGLPRRVKNRALGFLVLRYDRFLWKQQSIPTNKEASEVQLQAFDLLAALLKRVPDETIWKQAKHLPLALLLLKRQQFPLVAQALKGNKSASIEYLYREGTIPEKILGLLKAGGRLSTRYNYYKAMPLLSEKSTIITQMDYGYRLGSIFVDILKRPILIFLLPFRLILLAFDMLSKRGREKQNKLEKEIINNHNQQQLIERSMILEKSAAHRLGVAILETFSISPGKIIKLPGKIKQIYIQTRSL